MKRQVGKGQRGKAKRSGDRASRTRPQTITRYRIALVQETQTPYGDLALSRPAEVAEFLLRELQDRPQEHMVAVYLDTRNRLIGWTAPARDRADQDRLRTC